MKDAVITIELLQPMLAAGQTRTDNPCRFDRSRSNSRIVFKPAWWHAAMDLAIADCDELTGIKASDVHVDLEMDSETEIFPRVYGDELVRLHECIPAGATLDVACCAEQHVSQKHLSVLFDRLGRYVGVSPFGHRLGYGKFKVLKIETKGAAWESH